MAKEISSGRKLLYYFGGLLMLCGLISFLSVFVMVAMTFGGNLDAGQMGMNFAKFGLGGMLLLIVGGIIRGMGALGLAGSGVILDPGQAREELEPYTRMAGGMAKDVLDEADIDLSGLGGGGKQTERVVMVRCQACQCLNEENSKFCQECGKRI